MKEERLNLLKSKLKDFDVEFGHVNGTPDITIKKEQVLDVCRIIKDDEELKFNWLVDAVGVDRFRKKDRYEVIYNVRSTEYNNRLFLRVRIDGKEPEMESLTQVWKSADWYEREAFDMVGIKFKNHPDLRRMYMPEDYEYHPLRKDFPLMGIPGSIPLPNK